MADYLKKRLAIEFETRYYTLATTAAEGEEPQAFPLGNASSGAKKILDGIVRVDFLDAQRNLTDGESRGRYESLSKRLSRYYARNLNKQEADIHALSAISESEDRLNRHFVDSFSPVLGSLSKLGYPGVGNYSLAVKAEFNATSILSSNANVHYELPIVGEAKECSYSLPDRYNGLGFKNLIYMAVEILDFHHSWKDTETDRPPIHLLLIEEPESHLHAQLQQVFIRQLMSLIPEEEGDFHTQVAVTTHSPHIIYENEFRAIRYFRRVLNTGQAHHSEVLDLSEFYDAEEREVSEFLRKYLKLTHCDLFFADAAVLVEGNVERLLIPLVIAKQFPGLKASHLTILEIGGAFAHKFHNLLTFLGIPTLVITDLDSISPKATAPDDGQKDLFDDDDDEARDASGPAVPVGEKCLTSVPGAVSSNETLVTWLPGKRLISDLIGAGAEDKQLRKSPGGHECIRVAYQTEVSVEWNGMSHKAAGRTLEEAFALENLGWCQAKERIHLGLRIQKNQTLDFRSLHASIFKRVNNFDKTKFALGLITEEMDQWTTPSYIAEGLDWLQSVVAPTTGETTQNA